MNGEPINRGWLITLGAILIVVGLMAVALPMAAGVAAEIVFGMILLVAGVLRVVYAFQIDRRTGLEAFLGVLYIAGGVLLLLFPVMGLLSLTLVLATVLIVGGFVRASAGLRARPIPGWGWNVAGGLLSIALGVLIWAGWPSTAVWVIGVLVGIELLFAGIAMLAAGWTSSEETITYMETGIRG